jgi:hypothetical protein
MNNQHAGLSQVLAEQHITEQRQQATVARLGAWQSPAASLASVEGGPWLVAAGPVASRRHPAASLSPVLRQLIDRRQPCPSAPAH